MKLNFKMTICSLWSVLAISCYLSVNLVWFIDCEGTISQLEDEEKPFLSLVGHNSSVQSLAVLLNGDLASGSYEEIKIWNPTDGTLKRTLEGHSDTALSLAVLPNGDLASGSYDGTIKIWNV